MTFVGWVLKTNGQLYPKQVDRVLSLRGSFQNTLDSRMSSGEPKTMKKKYLGWMDIHSVTMLPVSPCSKSIEAKVDGLSLNVLKLPSGSLA